METSSTPPSNLDQPAVFRRRGSVQLVNERTVAETGSLISSPDARIAAREAAVARKEASIEAAIATVATAFSILGSRALVILAAAGAFALFGWTALEPTGWRFATSCAFTLMVFGPALFIDRRGS